MTIASAHEIAHAAAVWALGGSITRIQVGDFPEVRFTGVSDPFDLLCITVAGPVGQKILTGPSENPWGTRAGNDWEKAQHHLHDLGEDLGGLSWERAHAWASDLIRRHSFTLIDLAGILDRQGYLDPRTFTQTMERHR